MYMQLYCVFAHKNYMIKSWFNGKICRNYFLLYY